MEKTIMQALGDLVHKKKSATRCSALGNGITTTPMSSDNQELFQVPNYSTGAGIMSTLTNY